MSQYLVDSTDMTAIADAIRQKDGTQSTMTVSQMPTRIQNIPSGGTDYMAQRVQGTLSSYTIPSTCTRISDYAFAGLPITSMIIPDGVTYIGASAFFNTSLTSITIPDGVTYIGGGAFRTASLTSITIPDSVTYIGGSAFQSTSLTSITIPDSVISIGDSAFSDSTLTSVTFGNNVNVYLGSSAFNGSSNLATLNNFDIDSFTTDSLGRPIIPLSCFADTALEGHISLGNKASVGLAAFRNRHSQGILYIHLTQTDTTALSAYYSFRVSTSTTSTSGSFNKDHCRLVVPYSADHSILTAYQAQWPGYSTIMIEENQ